jgi:hypothetical protein
MVARVNPSPDWSSPMPSTRFARLPRTAVVAGLAVLVASAGGATAASLVTSAQIKNGTIKEVDLQPDYREHLKPWFAKADATGKLLASRHVTGVIHAGPGDFRVTFNRSIQGCAGVATARGTATNEFYGFVTTYMPAEKVIRVVIRDPSGTPADGAGFNLASEC